MRVSDFVSEAYVGQGIISYLLRRGYKRLGKGADKVVFLEPNTGLVLLIFGTSLGQSGSATELTNAQKSFKTFYELTKADPSNEFLPNIIEYAPFMYGGKPYLQIRMERLFEFKGPSVLNWNQILADMADAIRFRESFDKFWNDAFEPVSKKQYIHAQISQTIRRDTKQQLIMHLGKDGLKKLWNTVGMLNKVAKKNGYVLDLHEGNFMLSSEGTPVIADPFFMGWGRST